MPSNPAERQVSLRVVLVAPPPNVAYAVQEGKGSAATVTGQRKSDGGDLAFDMGVRVVADKSDAVDFRGPVVQGPVGARFVYINIGTCAGDRTSCWTRRLKVPLTGIDWATAEPGSVLEARVPGTGRDGGPTCATVKPFAGWHRAR
jgi:hypothetical protein